MSSNDNLLYFQIFNLTQEKEVGCFKCKNYDYLITRDLTDKINLIRNNKNINGKETNIISSKNHNIYYSLKKNNIVYIVLTTSKVEKSLINDLIDEVDYQGINKYLDKKGELNNVGRQNLNYIIEKYMQSSNNNSKITDVNSSILEVKDEMKTNLKKIVSNIDNASELENRSQRISKNALLFRNDAESLKNKARSRNLKMKIFFIVLILAFLSYIVYLIIS